MLDNITFIMVLFVTVLVGIPFSLTLYQIRRNERLQRDLMSMIALRDRDNIQTLRPMRLTNYRRLYSHISDAKWRLERDRNRNVAYIWSPHHLYSLAVF